MSHKCEHKFSYDDYRHRWACVKCDRVAPKCFRPILSAIAGS